MKKVLLIALVLISRILNAQPDAGLQTKLAEIKQSLSIRFVPTGDPVNTIIDKLAESSSKGPRSTEFKLDFNQTVAMNSKTTNKQLVVNSTNLGVSGDVFYKGFSMADYLSPSRLRFTVDVLAGTKIIRSFDFSAAIKNNNPEQCKTPFTDSILPGMKAIIRNLHADYTSKEVNLFNSQVKSINDYYNAASQLDHARMLVDAVNPSNFEFLDVEQRKLQDAKGIVASVDACNYERDLNLNVFDPVNLLNKISALRAMIADREKQMADAFSNLYMSWYDKGVYLLLTNHQNQAKEAFENSLHFNPVFAPALYQMAKITFNNGDADQASLMLSDIFSKMNPDPETRSLSEKLAKDIYESWLDQASEKLNQHKYRKAEDLLNKASGLCMRFGGVMCTDELYSMQKNAHNGIYNDMIAEADELMKQEKNKDADSRINEAIDYRIKYKNEITVSSQEKFILTTLRQKDYDRYVADARNNFKAGKYSEALDNADAAGEISKRFQVKTATDYDKLKTDCAREYAFQLVAEGENAVTDNHLDIARNKMEAAGGLVRNYQLSKVVKLNDAMVSLQKRIFTTQCLNAQNEFDRYLLSGENKLAIKDYRSAGQLFESADSVLNKNMGCQLNTKTFAEERSEFLPAFTYLKLYDKAVNEMKMQQYNQSYNSYNEAGKYFGQFDVGKFQLTHLSTIDFIRQQGTSGMLVYAIDQFRVLKEYEASMNIYKDLILRKYDYRDLKGATYKLGAAVAARDKSAGSSVSWKEAVSKYCDDSREWRSFRKGFKKSW